MSANVEYTVNVIDCQLVIKWRYDSYWSGSPHGWMTVTIANPTDPVFTGKPPHIDGAQIVEMISILSNTPDKSKIHEV